MHRLRARVRGKGKEGVAASTSAGNRVGATLYWTRDPEAPFRGREGEGWGRLVEASAAIAADEVWQDLEAEWSGEAPAAATHLVVEGWHRRGAGTADAYGYFDSVSLVRKGGLVRAE